MFSIDWFIGKGLDVVSEGLLDTFAFMILYANNEQRIVLEFLFYQTVKFPIMLNLTINARVFRTLLIRDCNRNCNGEGFGLGILLLIKALHQVKRRFIP